MHDRRVVLGGLLAGAFSATGAFAGIPAVAQARVSREAAADEMIAFLRQELLKSITNRRVYEIVMRINERIIRHHPDAVDPRTRMPAADARFGPGEFDWRFSRNRRLSGLFPLIEGPSASDDASAADETADILGVKIANIRALYRNKGDPPVDLFHHIPVLGTVVIDPVSLAPCIAFRTRYSEAPLGTVWTEAMPPFFYRSTSS